MSEIPPTHLTLLARLTDANDREAWRQFVELYAPIVFQFMRRRGLQETDAADVVQDVLLRVAAAFRRGAFDNRRGRFRGWLLTIARNELCDWLEGQERRERAGGGTTLQQAIAEIAERQDNEGWQEEYEQRLYTWAAERVRSEVQSTTWAAFWQTTIEQRSGQEVAASLHISVAAVYLAKSRVMKRLREIIGEVDDESWAGERPEEGQVP